jgi:5'-phosphate synthase pdxT subunit
MAGKPHVGVLALQGGFAEHVAMLQKAGAVASEVRMPEDLHGLDGLVLPGGESTTMGLLLETSGLLEPLRNWVRAGRPSWGTCAGMILLADRVASQKDGGQPLIGGLDMAVERNHFGRQAQSFEQDLTDSVLPGPPFHAIFIRAPGIADIGAGVGVAARLPSGDPVAVRQGRLLATSFHPELTADERWHRYFVEEMVAA